MGLLLMNESVSPATGHEGASRRRLTGLLLKPRLQLSLGVYVLLFTVVFVVSAGWFLFAGSENMYAYMVKEVQPAGYVLQNIEMQRESMVQILFVMFIVYMLFVAATIIVVTHKLVGPTVPFRRHVQALLAGNYSSRVTLREKDAFPELADDLNRLADLLETEERDENAH